jgi:hypothetical protein
LSAPCVWRGVVWCGVVWERRDGEYTLVGCGEETSGVCVVCVWCIWMQWGAVHLDAKG